MWQRRHGEVGGLANGRGPGQDRAAIQRWEHCGSIFPAEDEKSMPVHRSAFVTRGRTAPTDFRNEASFAQACFPRPGTPPTAAARNEGRGPRENARVESGGPSGGTPWGQLSYAESSRSCACVELERHRNCKADETGDPKRRSQ